MSFPAASRLSQQAKAAAAWATRSQRRGLGGAAGRSGALRLGMLASISHCSAASAAQLQTERGDIGYKETCQNDMNLES